MKTTQIKIYKKLNCILLIFLLLSFGKNLVANNLGVSPIFNFTKKNYKAAPQNWEIAQSNEGIIYVANNKGLLVFDGARWQIYTVKNKTIVRSVTICKKTQKIYVGAQGEFGYFIQNNQNKLVYKSLTHLINNTFDDVWDIEIINDLVYFRTSQSIYIYDIKNNTIENVYNSNLISFLAKLNNTIYFNDIDIGLKTISEKKINEKSLTFFKNKFIKGLENFDANQQIIATINNGLFLLKNEKIIPFKLNDNNLLNKHSNFCFKKISDEIFAIGTSTFGIFIFNKNGEILQHINQKNGLQVNNILNLFLDDAQNLWLALNNGIDLVEISSAISYIYPQKENYLTGYAVKIFKNKIYFGTSSGVFSAAYKNYYNPTAISHFKFIKNSGGQVWNMNIFNNQLLINHHEGTFIVDDNYAIKTNAKNGAWQQIAVGKNKLLSGNYTGLSLLTINNNSLNIEHDFQNSLSESCRILVQDQFKNIWISHPYRGVFKAKFDNNFSKINEVKLYNAKNGLPSDLQNYVFKIKDEVIFTSENGFYSYNAFDDKFEPYEKWNKIFGDKTSYTRIIEANDNSIWFVNKNNVGLLKKDENGKYTTQNVNQLKNKLVTSFENIYPVDNKNVFIPFENGFIHLNPEKINYNKKFNALITSVYSLSLDSLLNIKNNKVPAFNYKNNSLAFKFSASIFANAELTKYQYKMDGYDKDWSDFSFKNEIEYTNLNSGKYNFMVKALNINNVKSSVANYKFKINPPWYLSIFAFAIYSVLLLIALLSLVLIPKNRYEKEISQLTTDHLINEEKRKVLISQLEKEKLELQVKTKNQENLILKEEKLKAELSVLKEQISPHFFFNMLNTLSSIVRTEKKDASLNFIDNISVVYRHLLDSESKNLVTINEELNFLMAYNYLLIKRFGTYLKLNVKINENYKNNQIVSLAFQILLENVVKHNKISKKNLVNVYIFKEGNFIAFENNINKKQVFESTGLGLANLNGRCKILLNKEIEIIANEKNFKVKIPILKI